MAASWFWSALVPFIQLDLSAILAFFTANIAWFFIIYCLAYVFYEKKKTLFYVAVITLMLWLCTDFASLMGWVWAVGGFITMSYLVRFVLLMYGESTQALKARLPMIQIFSFLVLLVLYNTFLR